MIEGEWLECGDPRHMLEYLRGMAQPRKLRWFACACVRAVWDLLLDERSQQAVLVAERYADDRASAVELAEAEASAFEVARIADLRTTVSDPSWAATRAAARSACPDAHGAASGAAFIGALAAAPWVFNAGGVVHHGDPHAKARARQRQCDLLREIIGNPFRPVRPRPEWLAWNDGVVVRMARAIYDEQRFTDLPVLGDALEEAGCDVPEVLMHCRAGSKHMPGCWVVDVVLGQG
jgi:hypothetical protein